MIKNPTGFQAEPRAAEPAAITDRTGPPARPFGFLLVGLALAATFLAPGCGFFFSEKRSAPPLSMFVDVPVPPELTIDENNSQVYEHPIGRVGIMRASGHISKEALLSNYREAMAQNGWTKESEFDSGERQTLVFSKAPRSAAVTVKAGWLSTEAEINVTAKQQPAAAPAPPSNNP